MRHHASAAALFVCLASATMHAEPFVITSGSFGVGRALIGTDGSAAGLLWLNPPPGTWDSPAHEGVIWMDASWQPGEYTSTLLGTTAPVQPLAPGPVPVGGTFTANNGASFYFLTKSGDYMPFLDSTLALDIRGGTFTVPSVFPPVDEEGLYLQTQPFTLHGTWTVKENGGTLFHGDISGRGRASLILAADFATGQSNISGVSYQFTPTPEPTTLGLLLVGAGAILVGRARTRGAA